MKTRDLIAITSLIFALSLGLQVPAYGTSAPPGTHGPVYAMPDINVPTGVSLNVWGRTTDAAAAKFDLLFGDPANPGANIIGGAVANPKDIGGNYTYPRGDFTAKLIVYDGAGKKSGEDTVSIQVRDPVADALSAEDQLNLKINLAIARGLKWLYLDQEGADGSWIEHNGDGSTALGILAFENHGHQLTQDHIYTATVQAGLNYLFGRMKVEPISQQPAGNPEQFVTALGANVGLRMISGGANSTVQTHASYETGMALEAIVASGAPANVVGVGPAADLTYKNVAEEMVDYFAFSQTDTGGGQGGWDYSANLSGNSILGNRGDNSASQWVGLGLLAAEQVQGFSVTAPAFVKAELALWAAASQRADGAGGYTSSQPLNEPGLGTTGSLVILHNYLGTAHTPGDGGAVDKAFNWTDTNWFSGSGSGGNLGNLYDMYALFKALILYGRSTLPTVGDWYKRSTSGFDGNGIATWLVNNQAGDGSWTSAIWFGQLISTSTGVLMLAPTVIAGLPVGCEATVKLDPDTLNCANPTGFVAAYITLPKTCGVCTDIDLLTITLENKAKESILPVTDRRYVWVRSRNAYCFDYNRDKIIDRMIKFNRADVLRIANPPGGELTLKGKLLDGATAFHGSGTINCLPTGDGRRRTRFGR